MTSGCGANLPERLRWLRDHWRGGSGADRFARRLGLSKQSYWGYERGDHEPPARVLARIAEATGCNPGWLLAGEGEAFEVRRVAEGAAEYRRVIPILATASAADPSGRVAYVETEGLGAIEVPPGLHAVRIAGTSMQPLALPGQHVLVVEDEPRDGDLAVIDLAGEDEVLFKRIHLEGKTRVILVSINPDPGFPPLLVRRSDVRRMRRIWGVKF